MVRHYASTLKYTIIATLIGDIISPQSYNDDAVVEDRLRFLKDEGSVVSKAGPDAGASWLTDSAWNNFSVEGLASIFLRMMVRKGKGRYHRH